MSTSAGNAIWAAIREDAAIMESIGGKIYPNEMPQNVQYPAVVWGQLSERMLQTKDGPSNDGYQFQLDILAEDYATANSIAQALRTKLLWYEFTVADLGNVRISFQDMGDAATEEEKELFHIIQDYRVDIW